MHSVGVDGIQLDKMTSVVDDLDARLIGLLADHPRVGLLEIARRLGVARGTVTARLDKLVRRGAVTGFGPEVDPAAIGFPILAFVSLEIVQGRLEMAVEQLRGVPEVLEAHATSGDQDLLCRVVAKDPEHLQEIINSMVHSDSVRRSTSHIALSHQIRMRTQPLLDAYAGVKDGGA
ncbi:MAG: Lrp/AsnC family transcriptional regulator [Solirubrobacteraceae bacterium]|nr:Lrp/AsnC family transcriptional regulator [Solirubrobacteraceae bacterium]